MFFKFFGSTVLVVSLATTLLSTSARGDDELVSPLWENSLLRAAPPVHVGPDTLANDQPDGFGAESSIPMLSRTVPESVEDEIAALAEALGNDPVKIFNYVRNNINYEHYHGSRKGSVLTLLEGGGNDFDQCALLGDLLKAAGFIDIRYRISGYQIDYTDLKDWFGLADVPHPDKTYLEAYGKTIIQDFPNGQDQGVGDAVAKQATHAAIFLGSGGSRHQSGGAGAWYPNFPSKATLAFDRMFLTVTIGDDVYDLDPSYKIYERIEGLDILTGAGYNRGSLLTSAGGGTNANYAVSLNNANIGTYLSTLTSGLLNKISSDHPELALKDLIGGRRIVKHDITDLNDANPLPKVLWGTNVNETIIPEIYKSKLTFQVGGVAAFEPLNIADLKGRKISITFTDNTVEFRLDDAAPFATATVTTPTFNLSISITHPGGAPITETKTYKKNNQFAYAIIYGFSNTGKLLQKRNEQLAAYLDSGKTDSSKEVRTELLNIMGLTWLYQTYLAQDLLASRNEVLLSFQHRFGRMAQEEGFYVDVGLQKASPIPHDGVEVTDRKNNAFHLWSLFASAMEHGIIEQMQPGTSAVSTVNILRTANTVGQNLYRATSANWTGTVRPQLVAGGYPPATLSNFDKYYDSAAAEYAPETRLFLPRDYSVRPKLVNGSNGNWIGSGWVIRNNMQAGMIISGGYSGGYSYWSGSGNNYVSSPAIYSGSYYNPVYSSPAYSYTVPSVPPSYSTPSFFGSDPVNMATGAFEYAHTDMEAGIEAAPRGLGFSRSYSSANSTEDRQNMGFGWTHSMHIRAAKRTASEEALGLGTVQQAASFITAMLVSSDLYRDNATVQEWGTAALAVGWYVDQLKDNAVAVTMGANSFQFIKQPNGSYQAPAGSTMALQEVSGNFRVSQRHGNTMHFQATPSGADTTQCIQKIVDPDGKEMTFVYHADDRINYVQDCFSRRYTFVYTENRITGVTGITDYTNPYSISSVGFRYDAHGNLDRSTDPEGKFYYFDYEVAGDLGGTVATDHRIVRMRNHDNATITQNVYDSLGRVTEQYLHGDTNKTWKLRYTGTANTEEDPAGGVTTFFYDERGRSTGKRDPEGLEESWIYDGQDQVVEKTTGSGETTTYHYDSRHNLKKIDHPRGGGSTQMFYDSLDRLDLTIDPDGNQIDHVYSPGNTKARPDQIIDPQGTTTYQYNTSGSAIGRIWKVTDSHNLTHEYAYDANGHPDWMTVPGGFKTDYFYTYRGDMQTVTDPNNVLTYYLYNSRRQVTKITADVNGIQAIQDFDYNNQGLIERKTDARDDGGQRFSVRYEYSPTEKLRFTRTSDNDGEGSNDPVAEIIYDGRDWQSQAVDPAARLTIFTPKANGQPWKTAIPLSREKIQAQDGDGRPTGGTVPGSSAPRSSSLAYGVASSGYPQTTTTTADGLPLTEVQNRSGLPRFYTNRKGNVWEFRYDGLGRRTHVITPLDATAGRAHITEYQHRGVVKKITEPSGQITNYSYKALNGRLANISDEVGVITPMIYDGNGNVIVTYETRGGSTKEINRTFDSQNRLSSRTDESYQTIAYRYYKSGKLWKIIYPGGSENGTGHVEYTWWQSGQLKNVIDKLDSTTSPRITSYIWNKDGRLAKVTRDNGTFRQIKYDAAGRPDVIEEYGPDLKLIFVHKHGFYPSDEMSWRYTQPAKRTSGTDPPAMLAMTYNADNQIATWGGQSIVHDPDGNMTLGPAPDGSSLATYSYNARNQLNAALGTTYSYDSDGQRVGIVSGADTTTFVTDVSSRLSKPLVRTKNGVSTRYVWGLGLLYEINGSGGSATTVSYHHDATGSTIALTDDDGKVSERIGYTPWGQINYRVNVTGTLHDTPFLFTGFFGNQTDGNGLLYMRARYYHPQLGRFLNADPAQEGMNWYAYAGGNPIGMVDPMGLGIESALNSVQTVLSFLGMTPVFGAVFDVINAGISIGRGNYVDAAMNLASAIPGIGDFAMGAKLVGGGAAAYGGYKAYSAISYSTFAAKGGANFAEAAATQPNRIYSARELLRRVNEPGPFHNFPESFNAQIFEQGTKTVTPNFWRTARPNMSNDSIMYSLPGEVNGHAGMFEIGVRPSASGNTETIMHRFFRPNP